MGAWKVSELIFFSSGHRAYQVYICLISATLNLRAYFAHRGPLWSLSFQVLISLFAPVDL